MKYSRWKIYWQNYIKCPTKQVSFSDSIWSLLNVNVLNIFSFFNIENVTALLSSVIHDVSVALFRFDLSRRKDKTLEERVVQLFEVDRSITNDFSKDVFEEGMEMYSWITPAKRDLEFERKYVEKSLFTIWFKSKEAPVELRTRTTVIATGWRVKTHEKPSVQLSNSEQIKHVNWGK